jgi:membrane fusion protein (multidrug efflux system)
MLQFKRWLITLVLLFGVVAILGFIKFTQVKAAIAFGASFPESSETVEVVTANIDTWQPTLKVIGEVKATRSVQLRNEFEGIITEVAFASGGKVEKDDLLVQLDIAPELAQLDAIKAEINLAKLDVKRFADLLEVRASSRDQYDRALSQLAVNEARARALQATINRKTIRAPFSGNASIHEWEVGTYIEANTVITNLVGDLSTVWVDFSLPQWHGNIDIGSDVEVLAPELLSSAITAKVKAVNQEINAASRSMMVRATLDNPEGELKPGAIVNVLIPIKTPQSVYPIPNEGLRFDAFGSFVFALEKDDKGDYRATRKPVTVSARELNHAMISKGINSGDIIATVGSAKLSEGMLVYVAGAN